MNEKKLIQKCFINGHLNNSGLLEVLKEMNQEIERLKRFAKNSNTYGDRIFPDLVNISDDKK